MPKEFNFREVVEPITSASDDVLVIDRNLKGVEFQMARCCHPVYGDDVFGFVSVSGGIKIHRETCPNAHDMRSRFPYRIVKARWAGKGGSTYPITLHVVGQDDLGIVNNITSIISKEEHIMLRNILHREQRWVVLRRTHGAGGRYHTTQRAHQKLRTVRGVKAVSR